MKISNKIELQQIVLNQGFGGGSQTLYPPHYHSLSCTELQTSDIGTSTELQTSDIGTSLVRTDLVHIFPSSYYTRHIPLCSTTSPHLAMPIH